MIQVIVLVLLITLLNGAKGAYTISVMSKTVRLWTGAELQKAQAGTDLQLSTLLMNTASFGESEWAAYAQLKGRGLVKAYQAQWESEEEPVQFKAPNDEMARWFLSEEYISEPDELFEVITIYRDVYADPKIRLEYLRGELRAERISYGELHELQQLIPHIEPGDVELLEAAGVPEFPAKIQIAVTLSGGCCQAVHSSDPNVEVTLQDWDNINAGDADPLAEFHNDATNETDWAGAGMPHEVF